MKFVSIISNLKQTKEITINRLRKNSLTVVPLVLLFLIVVSAQQQKAQQAFPNLGIDIATSNGSLYIPASVNGKTLGAQGGLKSSTDISGSVGSGLIALTLRDQNGKLQIFTITPDGTNKKQLTFEGENGRPDWSPDGQKIVFMSMRDGKLWVAAMDADGSNQKLLVEGLSPDWSPDGKQIAFSRPDDRRIPQIWVMNKDGSNVRQITHSNTVKNGPSWSPDGKEMVFILLKNPGSSADPQPEIGIMNSDGTSERILTTEDRTNTDGKGTVCETANDANAPAWSPVDNRITFWSGIENQYGQVWVINSDGTGSQQLTEDCSHRNSDDPSWSPDGNKILFSTGRSGRNELWVMDADGENERKVSDIDAGPFPGRASWQPLSSVGTRRMAFVNRPDGVNHIYMMDIDSEGTGRNVARLTGSPEPENYPSWSPDGKKILYQRALNGSAIYVINADGSNALRLSPTPGFDVTPDWSPDGSQIVFTRVLGLMVPGQIPQTEIHVMNADGSADRVILPSSAFSVEPRWSVNNQIVFNSLMSGGFHIFTMNSDGGNLKQLTRQGNNGDPVWSPDGSQISFGSNREGGGKLNVYVMNADGSNVRQLTHFDVPFEAGDTHWSSDGAKISFEYDISGKSQSDPNAFAEVWTMNVDGSGQTSTQQRCSGVGCAPRWQPVVAPAAAPSIINGKVTDANNNPRPGVYVTLSGGRTDATATAANGNYSFTNLESSLSYTVTPSSEVFTFSPSNLAITLDRNRTDASFIASPLNTGVNQIDASAFFVRQHYIDFLNREPDRSGLQFWVNQIASCNGDAQCIDIKRQNVSAAYFLSTEFQETGFYVIRIQRAAFGKISSDATKRINRQLFLTDSAAVSSGVIIGQPDALQLLEQNKNSYAQAVAGSSTFIARYPTSLAAAGYVDALFASAGVTPQGTERQDAISAFGAGDTTGRAASLRKVAEANSVKNAEFNSAFVLLQYFGYLRRNPTDAPDTNDDGYQFWLAKLNSFGGDYIRSEMVRSFILSTEYRKRFGAS